MTFWFPGHGVVCVWTANLGARPSPLINAIGRIHYINCNGSQVGHWSVINTWYPVGYTVKKLTSVHPLSIPLPPGEQVTYPDRMREDQALHPLLTCASLYLLTISTSFSNHKIPSKNFDKPNFEVDQLTNYGVFDFNLCIIIMFILYCNWMGTVIHVWK